MNEEQLNFEALPDGKYLVKFLTEKASYNKFILAIFEITCGEHKGKRGKSLGLEKYIHARSHRDN